MTTASFSSDSRSQVAERPDGGGEYLFTNNWFESNAKRVWEKLFAQYKPGKVLEIGSYEGASTCYLIEKLAQNVSVEIHCIDSWGGGIEHVNWEIDMAEVEARFSHNTALAISRVSLPVSLVVHKGLSHSCLATLISQNQGNSFDLVYVDGSHQAPDVLADAVMAFLLLKVGGILIFDDYVWSENLSYGRDPLRCPKMAIDAFVNCYFRKVEVIPAPLRQLYMRKVAE